MKTIALSWRYLWSRPLGASLNVLLLSLGLASITFLLLVAHQVERAFDRDLAGIDVVVGAKGSPMQLILSGVLHLDVPPGNVPLAAVNALQKNPLVADQVAVNHHKADITPRQKAMLDFAVKVCLDSQSVGDQDYAELREHGFDDEDIWDITAITGFFGMSNRMANVTSMRPNDEFFMLGRLPKK